MPARRVQQRGPERVLTEEAAYLPLDADELLHTPVPPVEAQEGLTDLGDVQAPLRVHRYPVGCTEESRAWLVHHLPLNHGIAAG